MLWKKYYCMSMTTKVHFCATSIAEQWEFELTVLSFDVVVNGKNRYWTNFQPRLLEVILVSMYSLVPNCRGRGVKLQILGKKPLRFIKLSYENDLKTTPILRNLDNSPPGAFYSSPTQTIKHKPHIHFRLQQPRESNMWVNTFHVNIPFIYPLKRSESQRFQMV